jgi:uncharacterized protein (TIGR03000 family)
VITTPMKIEEKKEEKKDDKKISQNPNQATIVVELPETAKLYFDGAATTSTSNRRVFVSPELTPGLKYTYSLKAEMVRDGKTEVRTERVAVTAGNESQVKISFEPTAVAAK